MKFWAYINVQKSNQPSTYNMLRMKRTETPTAPIANSTDPERVVVKSALLQLSVVQHVIFTLLAAIFCFAIINLFSSHKSGVVIGSATAVCFCQCMSHRYFGCLLFHRNWIGHKMLRPSCRFLRRSLLLRVWYRPPLLMRYCRDTEVRKWSSL